jgi:hypothetical protein
MQKENKSFYFNVIKVNHIAKQVLDIPNTSYVLSFDYSVTGEGYCRNASCALNLISTFLFLFRFHISNTDKNLKLREFMFS